VATLLGELERAGLALDEARRLRSHIRGSWTLEEACRARVGETAAGLSGQGAAARLELLVELWPVLRRRDEARREARRAEACRGSAMTLANG